MNAIEKAKQFHEELSGLINRSLKDGAPLPSMVFAMSEEYLDLQLLMRDIRMERAQRELAGKIVAAHAIPPINLIGPHQKPLKPPGT
jgi:hypothetical protein